MFLGYFPRWEELSKDNKNKVTKRLYKYFEYIGINPDIRFNDGGSVLLAPNGKPSNLTPEQYRLVRTPAFKKWFGDWENSPETSSKVVDSNGEPLIVWHGTYVYDKLWNEFNNVTYFTDNKNTAKMYPIDAYIYYKTFDEYVNDRELDNNDIKKLSQYYDIDKLKKGSVFVREDDSFQIWENYDNKKVHTYECFLNFRNPKIIINADIDDVTDIQDGDSRIDNAKNENFDSIIGIYPYRWFNQDKINYQRIKADYIKEKHLITFNSNQIKLADGSNTTFDGRNPDIRFVKGGSVVGKKTNTLSGKDRLAKEKELIKYFTKYKAFRKKHPAINSYGLVEEYNSIRDKIMDLKYDLRKPKKVSEIESMRERKSAIPSNIIVVAWNDLVSNKKIFDAISEAMAGVHYNKNTAIDDIVDGINRNTSIIELYDTFINTRKVLKNKYGKTITLYRSHGEQMRKSTQNWISTLEGAEQYGGNIEKKEISIENIIALNVGMDANYEEFIVYIPKSTNGYASFEGIVGRRKHKNGGDVKFDFGGSIPDLLSIEQIENKIGRKINSWKDDVMVIGGQKYRKVYLRPEYKLM
jgi:hypothetical protein